MSRIPLHKLLSDLSPHLIFELSVETNRVMRRYTLVLSGRKKPGHLFACDMCQSHMASYYCAGKCEDFEPEKNPNEVAISNKFSRLPFRSFQIYVNQYYFCSKYPKLYHLSNDCMIYIFKKSKAQRYSAEGVCMFWSMFICQEHFFPDSFMNKSL